MIKTKKQTAIEREFTFTLTLSGITEITSEVADAIFEAGCDDATLSSSCGRVTLDFTRQASSLEAAVLSAIQAVRRAGIGADVAHIDEPSLVSQSEIARRTGRSRQQISQFVTGVRGPGSFPAPVCQVRDKTPLWAWYDVRNWLTHHNLNTDEGSTRDAEVFATVNSLLELNGVAKRNPNLVKEITKVLTKTRG